MNVKQLLAILTALPALTLACADYHYCLCQNRDGSFNDAATASVCSGEGMALATFTDGRKYCSTTEGSAFGVVFDNCGWREACNARGAAGDSNCWSKT